jgi:hypothetical protein
MVATSVVAADVSTVSFALGGALDASPPAAGAGVCSAGAGEFATLLFATNDPGCPIEFFLANAVRIRPEDIAGFSFSVSGWASAFAAFATRLS